MPSPTPAVSFKDRSVHEIHLENGYTYVIEQNLKHFSSVINVLAKFSEQILLQPTEDGLVMSASSSARSAYAKVKLCRQFFDRLRARENLAADGEVFCRLATKSLMHIFRSATHSALGPVPSCSLELDPQSDFAYVHLQCVSSIRRCFVLSLREHAMVCDNVFNERQRLKNRVTAHGKMLANLLGPLDCSDLELVALPGQFVACRYISREEYGKVRRTEVQIPVDHCEQYRIDVPTRVVVNLRELRPILQFADICGMSVTLHFDRAGRPLIVSVEENVDFAAEFVLGTLDEQLPINEQQQQHHQQQQSNQPQQSSTPAEEVEQHNDDTLLSQRQLLVRPAPSFEFVIPNDTVNEQQHQSQQQHQQLNIGDGQPSAIGHEQPSAVGHEQPSAIGHEQPSAVGHEQPSAIGHEQPSAIGHEQPSAIGHGHDNSAGERQNSINNNGPLSQVQQQQQVTMNDGCAPLTPLRPATPAEEVEQHNDDTPLSQGQLLMLPEPILEFVDPNEVPLAQYVLMNEPFQRLSVVPRPEGMSVWEQESDVGSRVHRSSSIVSRAAGGGGATTTTAAPAKAAGWMSKRSASQRRKQ